MGDLYLQHLDPDEFRERIVKEVAAELLKHLADQDAPRLVDRIKMAELAGIGVSTLDAMVADGRIPSVNEGRRRLFCPADVIEAMKNGSR